MFHSHDFLLFSLFFSDALLHSFSLSFLLLLVLLLNDGDSLVEFGQQVRQLGVDFVDEVAEIGAGFVIDSLEEHDRCEIFLEILDFVFGELSLQNINDDFFLGCFDLLCQSDDFLFELDDCIHIPPQSVDFLRVDFHYLSADQFDFVVGSLGDFVDEVSDGEFGTFGQNVLNVSTFDI